MPDTDSSISSPYSDKIIIDGARFAPKLSPKKAITPSKLFVNYTETVFCRQVMKYLESRKRTHVIFYIYLANSLKTSIRKSCGEGEPMRAVCQPTHQKLEFIPKNWSSLLRNDSKNTGLFSYLADTLLALPVQTNQVLIMTKADKAFTSANCDITGLSTCSHKECDTRIFVRIVHARDNGYHDILIKASDTDVVLLYVVTASVYPAIRIWVEYGTLSSKIRSISQLTAFQLTSVLLLRVCHSFTQWNWQKTTWNVWRPMPHITDVFIPLYTPQECSHRGENYKKWNR